MLSVTTDNDWSVTKINVIKTVKHFFENSLFNSHLYLFSPV